MIGENEKNITSSIFYNGLNLLDLGKSIDSIPINHSNKSSSNSSENLIPLKKNDITYLCNKCKKYPIFQFLDKANTIYTCNCNIKNNRNIIEIIDNLDNNASNRNLVEENKGFKCINNKSKKIKKFKYYCPKCKENLCNECCQDHPCGYNYLKNFDYMNQDSKIKIEFIKKKIKEFNKDNIIINNNSKENILKNNKCLFNGATYSVIMYNNGTYIIPKEDNEIEDMNIDNYFFKKLVYIILNNLEYYPNYSHYINIDNIYSLLCKREMIIKYNYNDQYGIRIFGDKFVKNNKKKLYIIIDNEENELKNYYKLPYKTIFSQKNNKIKNIQFSLRIKLIEKETIDDMSYMFEGCKNLISLEDISNWDTCNIKDMSYMFSKCISLKSLPDIIYKWDISKVTNISGLFHSCDNLSYLPDLSKWNTINIINMKELFYGCKSLYSLPDISKWNTNKVINMSQLFSTCCSLKKIPDIFKWDTSKVINISGMFLNCKSITELPDISKWNTTNVTDLSNLFDNCECLLKLPEISKWDVSNVKDMSSMFQDCISLKTLPDLSLWKTLNIIDINCMFKNCKSLLYMPDISKWITTNVTNMNSLFYNCCTLINLPNISKWNTSNVIDMSFMFYNCCSLKEFPDISNWKNISLTKSNNVFFNCISILSLDKNIQSRIFFNFKKGFDINSNESLENYFIKIIEE